MSGNKKTSFGTYVLYIALAAMLAPYFFSQGNDKSLIKIGGRSFQYQEVMQVDTIMKQIIPYEVNPLYFPVFYTEGARFTNPLPKNFHFLQLSALGLHISDEQVDSLIHRLPALYNEHGFSLVKQQEFLKTLKMTEPSFKKLLKEMLLVHMLMILNNEFVYHTEHLLGDYLIKINRGLSQNRHGQYFEVTVQAYTPQWTKEEYIQLENFYINNQEQFQSDSYSRFQCIDLGEVNDTKLKEIISDLQTGMSFVEIGEKWSMKVFALKMLNNQIEANIHLTDEIKTQLIHSQHASELKQPKLGKNGKSNILYYLDIYNPASKQPPSYFYKNTLKAWRNKDTNHPIIKAWIQEKTHQQKLQKAQKLIKNWPTLPAQNINVNVEEFAFRSNPSDKLRLVKVMLCKSSSKNNKIHLVDSGNHIFLTKLNRIAQKNTQNTLNIETLRKLLLKSSTEYYFEDIYTFNTFTHYRVKIYLNKHFSVHF